MSDAPETDDRPLDDAPLRHGGSIGARTMTRWIGTGVGAALLITVLSLAFANDCVTSAQSHVMAVVLALGVALLMWGIVGGLQIDVKLKFKALGEVTAAGVAAIFLVVHFVSADGIIAAEDCTKPTRVETHGLAGRVHEQGKFTKSIEGATIKIELPSGIIDATTDADGQFSKPIDGRVTSVKIWAMKAGYDDSEIVDVALPLVDDKVELELRATADVRPPRPGRALEKDPGSALRLLP